MVHLNDMKRQLHVMEIKVKCGSEKKTMKRIFHCFQALFHKDLVVFLNDWLEEIPNLMCGVLHESDDCFKQLDLDFSYRVKPHFSKQKGSDAD